MSTIWVPISERKSWGEEENDILKKYYGSEGAMGCCKYFETRTLSAIKCQADLLQLRYDRRLKVSAEMDEAVIKCYKEFGSKKSGGWKIGNQYKAGRRNIK